MLRSYFNYVTILLSMLLLSCTSPEEKQQQTAGDNTYQEFKDFVVATEEDAEAELKTDESDTTATQQEIEVLKSRYASYEEKIDESSDQFTPHQREVLMDLKERYKIALDKKQKKHEEANRRYKLRQEMLGVEVSSDDLSEITPTNIKTSYQTFVNSVSRDLSNYSERDWEIIEGFWSALNTRKEQLEDQLKSADKGAISKLQEKYLALRNR